MQSFRIRPDGFKEIRKKMLIIMIPTFLVIITIITVTNIMNTGNVRNNAGTVTYHFAWTNELLLPLAIVVLSMAVPFFAVYRIFSRLKMMYESYELQISNNLIAREQLNTPTISIYLTDVQEIVKRKNGSFLVRGTKAIDLIMIPKQIENRDQLETALEQIKPITTKSKNAVRQYIQALLGLAAVGLMICVNTVNNKGIVTLAGTAFTAIMIWNLIQTQKSKNVDYRSKRLKWISLIAVIAVIYIVILKLTSPEMP